METMDGHPSGRAPTRALGALFVLGALLSASTLLLPADPGIDRLAIGLLDVFALTAGVVLLTVGTRLPGPSIPTLLGMAIVVIAAGAHYADEPAGGYVPTFFLWVGLYAGWFLSERLVAVSVAAVGSAYAVVLIIDPVETAVAHWLVVVGTTAATSGIVSVLVGQARRRAAELVRSERAGRAVLESAQEAYVIVDDHDVIVDVNPAAERTLGWPKDEARGQKVEIALTASSRRYRRDALRRFHEDGDASLLKRRTEVTFRHREGHEVPVEVTLSPIEVAGRQYFVSALHDISDRKAADRILDAQYQVRSVLAESRSFEDALLDLLRAQSESLGWDLGAYWALDEDTGRLRRLEVWRAGDVGEAFAEVAELALSSAVGQVWETGQSRWLELEDEAERSTFARHGEAERSGLRSGLVLPVRAAGGPVAVAEFYSRERRPPDREVIVVMTALNAQIGAFVERQRAEEREREHAETIAAVAQATRRLSATTDPADARQAIVHAARTVADGDGAGLYEPDFERNVLVRTAGGHGVGEELPLSGAGETSATVRVFQSGEPLFVGETRGDPAVGQSLVRRSGMRSAVWQPVIEGGRVVGVLVTAWRRPLRHPPERLQAMLQLLADEAAVAIQRTELLARLRDLARSDELTGLENRRSWEELLERELARSRRDGLALTIGFLAVDGEALIGERALKEAAVRWRDTLRDTDVLARLEGRTFATLHPGCEGLAALELIDQLMDATPHATCAAGLAALREEDTVELLAERACQALTLAKRRGGIVLAG
jgi:PAS domain S-box-containing protein/diguanylate cyclase (GGDEF)-like protein